MVDAFDVLNVVSNVAFLPAVFYAFWVRPRLITEAVVILVMTTVSAMYHACLGGMGCMTFRLSTWQLADHFMVYSTLAWVAYYVFLLRLEIRLCAWVVTQAILFVTLHRFSTMWWYGFSVAGFVLATCLLLLHFTEMEKGHRVHATNVVVAAATFGTGVSLHIMTDRVVGLLYGVTHPIWHFLAGIALFFLLDHVHGHNYLTKLVNAIYERDGIDTGDTVRLRSPYYHESLQGDALPPIIPFGWRLV
jgi:hypothetical protein